MSGEITITIPADAPPERMQAILEAAGREAVIRQAETPADPEAAMGWAAAAFDRVIQDSVGLPDMLGASLAALRAESGHGALVIILISLGLMALAYAAELAIRRVTPARAAPAVGGFGERLVAATSWLIGRVGSIVVFALVALVLSRIFIPAGMARQLFTIALAIVLLQRVVYTTYDLISAPRDEPRRLAGMTDAQARRVASIFIGFLVVTAALRIGAASLGALVAGGPQDDLAQILITLGWFVIVAVALILARSEYAALIRKEWGELRIGGRRVAELAGYWVILGVALALATALAGIGMILGSERSGGFSGSFIVFALTPFVVAGISGLKRERVARLPRSQRAGLEGWYSLAEGGALVVAAVLLLRTWSIDPFDASGATGAAAFAPAIVSAAVAVIIGVSAWRAVKSFISAYQPAPAGETDETDDGLGKTGSRIGTMLPVLRGFLLALISTITVMVALSALGVDVAPLIAGAGVFGLAIGFGSQKIVADVISGVFYLYEDAFRVGEYIEAKEGKGIVQSISFRSALLRHHRGSLYTIPFSQMGTVQNHSRDWVKVKFSFQVPVETDVEKVRKLVKKVGEQLMEDPELEGKFIEPVKSQGAVAIKGHSFEIGVKYMSKPGQQFVIRRKAYAALQKAFEENGIKLYRPSIGLDPRETLDDSLGVAAPG